MEMKVAYVYGYQFDFSNERQRLVEIKKGDEPTIALVNSLRVVTNNDWRLSGESEYSLEGAKITYNGKNEPYMLSNSNYTNLLTIELGEACLGLYGTLIVQYNLPADSE